LIPQLIMLIILLIIGKLLGNIYKEKRFAKSKEFKGGQVIDLSDAWIDLNDLPYQKKQQFLSAIEVSIYMTLNTILEKSKYMVFPKISLANILDITPGAPNRKEYLFRLKERNIDFVICELPDFKPLVLIIIEGQNNGKKKELSDRLTRNAAEVAKLPYIGLNPNKLSSAEELINKLQKLGLDV